MTHMNAQAVVATPPSLVRIAREQLSILAATRQGIVLALGLVGSYALARAGLLDLMNDGAWTVLSCYPLLLVASVVWAAVVWGDDGPGRRDYHDAMPVGRVTHALLRVGAGAIWLELGLAALAIVSVFLDLLNPPSQRPNPVSFIAWVNYLSGPLTVYLLSSAAAVLTRFPLRWALVVAVGYSLIHRACGLACSPAAPLRDLVLSGFGLLTAVIGSLRSEVGLHVPAQTTSLIPIAVWLLLASVAVVSAAAFRRD